MVPDEVPVEPGLERERAAPRDVCVEVCVEGLAGLRAARAAGARRVELCCALAQGGLTPSRGLLEACVAEGGIEVVVLVRPRPGDFLYTSDELAVLQRDVDAVRAAGAAGVALGCLTAEGRVDAALTGRLIERAQPVPVTFHRAFDLVREPERALETLLELGAARVLTSGQAPSAFEGRERIGALVRAARGRLCVIAAGGIRPEHALALVRASGVRALHLSAATRRASAMRHRNPQVRLGRAAEEYEHWETDEGLVRALVRTLGA
jgi:copper homeostasis protein